MGLFFLFAPFDSVFGVPAFARQTEQQCIACHVSFPELTPYGRYFKLSGYTLGKAAISSEGLHHVPLAVMAEASITSTRNNHSVDPDTGDPLPAVVSWSGVGARFILTFVMLILFVRIRKACKLAVGIFQAEIDVIDADRMKPISA